MFNIVVPIAGRGERFKSQGYRLPKPLIPIHGYPMIEIVVHNIRPPVPHRFIFVALKEHLKNYPLQGLLERIAPGCVVVAAEGLTQGAACTVLLAQALIDHDEPLMIANSDQWFEADIQDYLTGMAVRQADGWIMTMRSHDPKWSYIERGKEGSVTRVVEKQVISEEATVGIYNFKRGRDFVRAARQMIADDLRVNGEFYVAPTLNEMIRWGAKVGSYQVGEEGKGMYGLGTPSDLELFIRSGASLKALPALCR